MNGSVCRGGYMKLETTDDIRGHMYLTDYYAGDGLTWSQTENI